jgi:hypothetical protein
MSSRVTTIGNGVVEVEVELPEVLPLEFTTFMVECCFKFINFFDFNLEVSSPRFLLETKEMDLIY